MNNSTLNRPDVDSLISRVRKIQETSNDRSKKLSDKMIETIKDSDKKFGLNTDFNTARIDSGLLPMWPDAVVGLPNSIIRSALFSVTKIQKKEEFLKEKIASTEDIEIIFSGPQLDQADLDVWMECLHLCRESCGTPMKILLCPFLKNIGRKSTGGNDVEWLKDSLRRLALSTVEIKDKHRHYMGSLISEFLFDAQTKECYLTMSIGIVTLYKQSNWTALERAHRIALKRNPLALWLHAFYSTHAAPYPYRIETIFEKCGSQCKDIKHFKPELRRALHKVCEVSGWQSDIDKNKVFVQKKLAEGSTPGFIPFITK